MKKISIFVLLTVLLILAANCFAGSDAVEYTNGGLTLPVPEDIAERVVIEMPEDSDKNILFRVCEKASIEAAQPNGEPWSGAGWLFSIGWVTEDRYHEMICDYMTGVRVFAKNDEGIYYMFYHPTDVRMVREDYTDIEDDLKEWGALNKWADSMPAEIIKENGLTEEKYGNGMLEIYLARLMYRDDMKYTVSTTEYGPMEPKGVKASDYIEPLVTGVTIKTISDEEAPDGEYVVLEFPDNDIRFDFFMMEGKENYVRQVWYGAQHESLYKVEFDDENLKAADIMHALYEDMVLANSLGYTPDDMIGVWAEKIAGRGSIEIRKGDEEGIYNVNIHWSGSAFESYFWTMTAVAVSGPELRYEDCTLTDILFTSEDESTETVLYENGTGSFSLLSTYELVWNDETGHAGDDAVFINAGS